MQPISAQVMRNLEGNVVELILQDGRASTAVSPVWLPPGSIVWVRADGGAGFTVIGRVT